MGSTLLDGAVLEPGSIVAAGAILPPGIDTDVDLGCLTLGILQTLIPFHLISFGPCQGSQGVCAPVGVVKLLHACGCSIAGMGL